MSSDLVERAQRWAQNTGFDGDPQSVPMQMIAALEARDKEIARLREIVNRYGDKLRMANAPDHLQQTIDDAIALKEPTQ